MEPRISSGSPPVTERRDGVSSAPHETMRRFVSNASYLFVSHLGRVGSQLIGMSIIARLLTPADFGTVSIAMVVSNLAGLLRDLGTGPAAIRSREATPSFFGGIYAVQMMLSLFLAVAICAAAPLLASFYRTDSLRDVLITLSVVFPITALGSVHLILLERQERYKAISMIELASYVAGLAVAAILAYAGVGVLSLALQAVVNAAVQTYLMRRMAAVTIAPAHPRHARSVASGSAAVTSFHLFNYVAKNLDAALAGRLATVEFVGSYSMATRISQLPSQAIGMLLSRASIPMLSRGGQEKTELTRNVAGVIDLALWASAAACVGLASFRTFATGVLFGPQWLASVPSQLTYLLPAAALGSIAAVLVGIMTALGAGRALTVVGAFTAVAHVCILAVCLTISARLLPLAVFISGVAALTFASVGLLLMLRERGIEVVNVRRGVAVLLILIYPVAQLVIDRLTGSVDRALSRELVEGGLVVASSLLLLGLYLRPRVASRGAR